MELYGISQTVPHDAYTTTASSDVHVQTTGASSGVPVFGLPGHLFYVVHVTALVSMSITMGFSIWIITTFFCQCPNRANRRQIAPDIVLRAWKQHGKDAQSKEDITNSSTRHGKSSVSTPGDTVGIPVTRMPSIYRCNPAGRQVRFRKRPLAERLVLYMSVIDLSHAVFHTTGMWYFIKIISYNG